MNQPKLPCDTNQLAKYFVNPTLGIAQEKFSHHDKHLADVEVERLSSLKCVKSSVNNTW